MPRPKTVFCDIDGTLVTHTAPCAAVKPEHKMILLEGTIDKLHEWDCEGHNVILTTGRRESMREATVRQLEEAGVIYDELVMGIGGGERILINDRKSDGRSTARSVRVDRDAGIANINLVNIEEEATRYFYAFAHKDLQSLGNMFDDNISLKDWNIDVSGKNDVLKANGEIFSSCQSLSIGIVAMYSCDMTVIAEISIGVDDVIIPVTDIITFNSAGKIGSIVAYRGN